jgi:RHS repeat-associated protein
VNELTTQDTDSNGSTNNTLAYDPAGNLNDDGVNYKYVYDPFYRLRFIKTQGGAVVEEFTYNGLGHQIGWHYDNDRSGHTGVPDGTVDANDAWYYKAYDENWRQVATFRGSDATPKEIFLVHQAGNDGLGGASYINGVICRKRDADTTWTAATDGVLEETEHYCQNWRGDVVGLVDSGGSMTEWAKHSAYGVPFCLPVGDTGSVGARSQTTDANQIQTWINGSAYDVRGDTNLDGVVNTTDKNYVMSHAPATGGRGLLSVSTNANRVGLAGYAFDDVVTGAVSHVRNRDFDATRGRWIERDQIGYDLGSNLYEYCDGMPTNETDVFGLLTGTGGYGGTITGRNPFIPILPGSPEDWNPSGDWTGGSAGSGSSGTGSTGSGIGAAIGSAIKGIGAGIAWLGKGIWRGIKATGRGAKAVGGGVAQGVKGFFDAGGSIHFDENHKPDGLGLDVFAFFRWLKKHGW